MLFKTWILNLFKKIPLKQKVLIFFFKHKELLCYRMQWIMFRVIGTNKYFKLSIWLLVKSYQLLSKRANNLDGLWWILSQKKWTIARIKTRKRILTAWFVCGGKWWRMAICYLQFFPRSRRKFQSGFDMFFFLLSVFNPLFRKNQYSGLRK